MTRPLLSRESLPSILPVGVTAPLGRPERTRMVHLGIGAFARAHPILYTELAAETAGDSSWGILGVTGRSPDVAAVLDRQHGLYGVMFRSAADPTVRLVGSLTEVAAIQARQRVVEAIASPDTSIITLTVTEKAYRADGHVIQVLAAGLRARHAAGGHPVSVLSCDNLASNGATLRGVLQSALSPAPDLARWMERDVDMPSSMVDRITPETTAEDRAAAAGLTGFRDDALVVAEPFGQWVIEDRFASPRPRWEAVGVELVDDVAAHEEAKIRLLNGTHTLLACAGAVRGFDMIAEAVRDPLLLRWCREWQDDARQTIPRDAGGREYSAAILERLANPALHHTTRQIARDTSQKIETRILTAARLLLGAGRMPRGAAFAVGAWVAFVWTEVRSGRALDDPRSTELEEAVRRAGSDLERAAEAVLDTVGDRWPVAFTTAVAQHALSLVLHERQSGQTP